MPFSCGGQGRKGGRRGSVGVVGGAAACRGAGGCEALRSAPHPVLGPAVGALRPEKPRAALALQHVGRLALQL